MTTFKKYRKKPIRIEAVQLTDNNRHAILSWINADISIAFVDRGDNLVINTAGDKMTVPVGDWVIKGVEGEFYRCPASVFERSYEEA